LIEDFERLVNEIYSTVDKKFEGTEGGSTSSLVLLFTIRNRLISVSINLGDSPILLLNSSTANKVLETSYDCTWENIDEYTKVVENCNANGKKPPQAIYGRYNTPGSKRLPNILEKDKPFPLYKFVNGKPTFDKDTYDAFTLALSRYDVPGGTQTSKYMTVQRLEGTQWHDFKQLEGYETTNWGSTVSYDVPYQISGSIQVSRSFGDFHLKRCFPVIREPSIYIHELEEDFVGMFITMSDGLADCLYNFEICEKVMYDLTAQELSEKLMKDMITKMLTTREFIVKDGKPTWDDCSISIIKISSTV